MKPRFMDAISRYLCKFKSILRIAQLQFTLRVKPQFKWGVQVYISHPLCLVLQLVVGIVKNFVQKIVFRWSLHTHASQKLSSQYSIPFTFLFSLKHFTSGGISTMSDFHNFGLTFAGQMHCLPQRLKSTLFEIFSNGGCPKDPECRKNFKQR